MIKFSKALRWFRILFPSWRFFESSLESPRLMVSWGKNREELDQRWSVAWLETSQTRHRRWFQLFYSPDLNLRMAYRSLVEQTAQEVGEWVDQGKSAGHFTQTAIYQMMEAAAIEEIHRLRDEGSGLAQWGVQLRSEWILQSEIVRLDSCH